MLCHPSNSKISSGTSTYCLLVIQQKPARAILSYYLECSLSSASHVRTLARATNLSHHRSGIGDNNSSRNSGFNRTEKKETSRRSQKPTDLRVLIELPVEYLKDLMPLASHHALLQNRISREHLRPCFKRLLCALSAFRAFAYVYSCRVERLFSLGCLFVKFGKLLTFVVVAVSTVSHVSLSSAFPYFA